MLNRIIQYALHNRVLVIFLSLVLLAGGPTRFPGDIYIPDLFVPLSTFPVGVFNSQQHLPAIGTGKQPVEQGSTGTPDVQVTGRRWGKTADVFSHAA